jgi:hypothetical protein
MTKLREVPKDDKINKLCDNIKYKTINYNIMFKKCCKCKIEKSIECFGKLKSSKDNLRYDCNDCRKLYRMNNREQINKKLASYYISNKEKLLKRNKEYREINSDTINKQRQEYRNRPEIKEHIKIKSKEYLPERKLRIKIKRQNDLNFKISEIMRSKIHKMLKNQPTSYQTYIGCDMEFFKKWIEFRFSPDMNWNNIGKVWQIDHILPINSFNFNNENDKYICFHWTNLQPLNSIENRQKSDKLILHYYYNNIVNINRFNQIHTKYLGYQIVNESLQWLRIKLGYGKKPSYDDTEKVSETDNPQPSS